MWGRIASCERVCNPRTAPIKIGAQLEKLPHAHWKRAILLNPSGPEIHCFPMILNLNHLHGKSAGATAQDVVETVYKLVEEGQIAPNEFASLRIQLDWIQYKQNFREVVSVAQGSNPRGPIMDVHIDTRQVVPGCLRDGILRAMARANPETSPEMRDQDRLPLEDFQSLRSSVVWEFNKLYWMRLRDWEEVSGKSYERSLPGGVSDGNQPQAIADSVGDFWTLLKDMEAKKNLPPEVYILEIGVGTGIRMGLWLDKCSPRAWG